MSASAPPPPPPPPPPPSKSNQPMHYFHLPSELKWASKDKTSPDPTRRRRSSKLPRKSNIGQMAKQSSSSSSLQKDIPKSNNPHDISESNSQSLLDFIRSLSGSTSADNVLVNSEGATLQKFQKECSISGFHIVEIENKGQQHDEDKDKKEEHVEDEDKGKQIQVDVENTEENKDHVGKEGKNPQTYLRRSKMRGKELIKEKIEM